MASTTSPTFIWSLLLKVMAGRADDVVIGQNQAIGTDNHTTTQTVLRLFIFLLQFLPKKVTE
ncbi:protein FAR-RED IMPAIRED RESPONSE 1-like protein [Corchorus olitorius]|uniref:Protein FAR-RED IMPAIRED RESPONSE 1-like protein n=1 Tax=Corchorus olitorius TaxID=93759 RepID=A0A1R3L2T1_9ROSI|nr:protein FAR-RED IMPAIRED RESPONSE 1-like protein [Corchorus olitorius]